MQPGRPVELGPQSADDRGAASAAPRSTPLELVSAAIAGEELAGLVHAAADALGSPVAVVIPALGPPIAAPREALPETDMAALSSRAASAMAGEGSANAESAAAGLTPVRLGRQVVGLVARAGHDRRAAGGRERAWLEATATAAAVAMLVREAREIGLEGSRRGLLEALRAGPPADVAAFVSHGRRLGFELSAGAVALCARAPTGQVPAEPLDGQMVLSAELGDGRLWGLLPLADGAIETVSDELTGRGLRVALSGPRQDPAALHDGLREAELLLELGCTWPGQDQTYRLLVGILLRDPAEVEQLHGQTIAALKAYDERHDTDLLATLSQFLVHHGSTTDTAEAMHLHRHTVGYRLARVHELSGLSPYESEGRERLSLGLKAQRILAAHERLTKPG